MEQDDTAVHNAPPDPLEQQVALHEGSARQKSLVVAAFPWFHGEMLSANNLSDVVPADQLYLVSNVNASHRLFVSEHVHSGS